ncbi:MAG: ZIP family metal transporter [candidate division Zixibacteria bacterium]|nr:ZIP family metal transporter [candidate division Zixibacteria bacterium]
MAVSSAVDIAHKPSFIGPPMNGSVALYSLIVFVVAMSGGILALVRRWTDTQLHMIVAFGAGVFLGATFVHLLPQAMSGEHGEVAGLAALVGFLLVLFIERFLLTRSGKPDAAAHHHSHLIVSTTALIGLMIHTIIGGLGLAVASVNPKVGDVILISILAHKIPETFVMVTLMMLAGIRVSRILINLTVLCAMTPVGALVLSRVALVEGNLVLSILTGIVAGTFLYVATGNLLPEVFHLKQRRGLNLVLLIIGAVIMAALGFVWHEGH